MFTGLIEEVGAVRRIARSGAFQRLEVNAAAVLEDTKIGDSLNINGACQTVVEMGGGFFAVETVAETLRLTTLGDLATGDPVNLGYQDYRYLVVTKVNGKAIHHPRHIQEALKQPNDGFHIVEFAKGSQISRMVFDANEMEAATARVLDRYGIPKNHNFN